MNPALGKTHITDDMGNDVIPSSPQDDEYAALCAVAEAAEQQHRAHCLLPTPNCPLCSALAALDSVEQRLCAAQRN